MPPERMFSFEHNDDQTHHQHEEYPQDYEYEHNVHHDPNSLPRDLISPPPQYTSPPPPEASDEQSARELWPLSDHSHSSSRGRRSSETSRRPVASNYVDSPPPPPPHREIPNLTSRQDSEPSHYQPALLASPGMERYSSHGSGETPRSRGYENADRDHSPESEHYAQRPTSRLPERASYGSNVHLAGGAATPGTNTPGTSPHPRSSAYSGRSIPLDDYPSSQSYSIPYANYHDSPYQNSSLNFNPAVSGASINPNAIADDGDDGFMPEPKRKSVLPMGKQRSNERMPNPATAGAAVGGAGVLGGMFGHKARNHTASGNYNPVTDSQDAVESNRGEKSEWLTRQTKGKNKMRWTLGVVIGLVIVIAIVAGIVGGVLGTHNNGSSGGSSSASTNNAATDTAVNGDLGKDSSEIQALMNNQDLHKVFPGIDYTPWGTQYPLCMTYPPSQNNVTRDMAVLSQLTNAVRLYGTDCNQTEMVLHAIDRLGLTDMKVWLGVWIDTNQTTTDRQLDQMYTILKETKDLSIFKGAIVGNEALYRAGEDKAQSEQELITILTDVKSQFKTKGYDIPVATSDLGDNWNGQLVQVSDMVMSNIHPFFAGVTAEVAAGWTWDFWQNHDVVLTQNDATIKQIISETGWPSDGGTDCGGTTGACTSGQSGSVANVDNMNTFMADWVCQALENGTDYFWFEAFDEPWKVVYNTASQNWEDKWGLMDPARNLKDGLKIPDCGGKTVSS